MGWNEAARNFIFAPHSSLTLIWYRLISIDMLPVDQGMKCLLLPLLGHHQWSPKTLLRKQMTKLDTMPTSKDKIFMWNSIDVTPHAIQVTEDNRLGILFTGGNGDDVPTILLALIKPPYIGSSEDIRHLKHCNALQECETVLTTQHWTLFLVFVFCLFVFLSK